MYFWEGAIVLLLRLKAPFAAFRLLQGGVFRSTAPTISPTAAYGLLLNLAAIETRDWSKIAKPSTPMVKNLPEVEIAIAALGQPETATLLQQSHNVPVGKVPPENWERTKGCKPNIKPVRREVLVGFEAAIAVRCQEALASRIVAGLDGEYNSDRYGLPFAGDNNFLFDEIEVVKARSLHWYARMEDSDLPRPGICRLTTWIDRTNSSKTKVEAFAPITEPVLEPPSNAWTALPLE